MAESGPSREAARSRKLLRVALFALLACVMVFAYESWAQNRYAPPSGVRTLAQFLAWDPSSNRFLRFSLGEREYVAVLGPRLRLLASGPPVYLFDESGSLIDWTDDCEDDPAHRDRWPSPYEPLPGASWVTEDEATEFARQPKRVR